MVKTSKFTWGSVITGIGLGLFLGYWFSISLPKLGVDLPLLLLLGIGFVIFGLSGYYLQKTTEILAFAVSIFIVLQYIWDIGVELAPGPVRNGLLWRALILLGFNAFSGHFKLKRAIRIFRKAIGIA